MASRSTIGIVAVVIVVAIGLTVYFLLQQSSQSSVPAVLSSINTYGANMRALLENSSPYGNPLLGNNETDSALRGLVNLSYDSNWTKANLTTLAAESIGRSGRGQAIYAFAEFGLPVNGSNGQSLIPGNFSTVESLYTLDYTGDTILQIEVSLARAFDLGLFHGMQRPSHVNGLGLALPLESSSGAISVSTPLETNYTDVLPSTPLGWLGVAINVPTQSALQSLLAGQSITGNIITSTGNVPVVVTPQQFFYALSFNQYAGYTAGQIIYSKSIAPRIMLIGYINNTLVINAGNIPPVGGSALVSVDGKQEPYTRYYNFFLVRMPLSIGMHSISVSVDNQSLNSPFWVNPDLDVGGFVTTSNSSFSIKNLYYKNITISNLSASGAVSYRLSGALTLSYNQTQTFNVSTAQPCAEGAPQMITLSFTTNYGPAQYTINTRCY